MAASRLPVAALALLASSGCGPFSTLDPAGPQARELGTLGWWLIALSIVTTLVMTGLVIGGAVRRRGVLSEHLPVDAGGGMRWVWLGTALPGIVLIALFMLRTYPRLRVDQLMHLCWKVLTPIAIGLVLLAGLWRLLMI